MYFKDDLIVRQRAFSKIILERIDGLKRNPVRGRFDVTHLKEIHRRIFQDAPKYGFAIYKPGQYRDPVPEGDDWIKKRKLPTQDNQFFVVAYSSMDEASRKHIGEILSGVDPGSLSKLNTKNFSEAMSRLYVNLDYLHPFAEGNSRTLRAFTAQLAKESGYKLHWSHFNQDITGRDRLYIARDLSVNEIALPKMRYSKAMEAIASCMVELGGHKNFHELMKEIAQPRHAFAFQVLKEEKSKEHFPELKPVYDVLHSATEYFSSKAPYNFLLQKQAKSITKNRLQGILNRGEPLNFHEVEKVVRQPLEVKAE